LRQWGLGNYVSVHNSNANDVMLVALLDLQVQWNTAEVGAF
jgi:NRPS condensation-like uncharacterized protein